MTGLKGEALLVADDLFADRESKKRFEVLRDVSVAWSSQLKKPIEIVHAEDLSNSIEGFQFDAPLINAHLKSQQKHLDERVKMFPTGTNGTIVSGKALDRFESLAKNKKRYEFMILSSHGYRGIKRLLLGSFTEEILRRSRIPVMVVGPKVKRDHKYLMNKQTLKVLVAADLSSNSSAAEEFAIRLSADIPIQVEVYHSFLEGLHPIYQNMMSAPSPLFGVQTAYRDLKKSVENVLKEKIAKFKKNKIKTSLLFDEKSYSASEGLLKVIKQTKPDLVIMGTHARNLVSGTFLGSTAKSVIIGSSVPVIVVNPKY